VLRLKENTAKVCRMCQKVKATWLRSREKLYLLLFYGSVNNRDHGRQMEGHLMSDELYSHWSKQLWHKRYSTVLLKNTHNIGMPILTTLLNLQTNQTIKINFASTDIKRFKTCSKVACRTPGGSKHY
jgi:uncharacterized protein YjaZ